MTIVAFEPANLEAIGNNHAVSDAVCKVTQIIDIEYYIYDLVETIV